jgi:hypothetical protein
LELAFTVRDLNCRLLFSPSLRFLSVIQQANTMSPTATRAVLRQSQFLIRRTAVRHNSSTSQAANKAKETVSNATSKAQDGLSKVTSSAGPAITSAMQNVGGALRKIGGPAGRVVSFVDRKGFLVLIYCHQ